MSKECRLLAGDYLVHLKSGQILFGLLLLGVIIRVGLVPFTLHVDPRFTGDIASFPPVVQAWNSPERDSHNYLYPPLAYHTLSAYLLGPAGAFTRDLWDQPILGTEARFDWLASPFVFRNLFILKAWYLLPDLGIAFLLWRMLRGHPARTRVGLIAWAFNPLLLYATYFHGQFDVVPVFFVLLSLFCARRDKPAWAAFWMGIGACYKNYPFALLLPLVLILDNTWRGRLKLLLLGVLPYLLLLLPRISNYAGMGGHFSGYFFPAGYDLGFGNQVFFFFIFYALLLWYLYHRKAHTFEALWRACFAILLVYYQFSYFDLHYWVWIVPFAAIYWVERPQEAKPFYLVIGFSLLVLLAPTPLARFLAPISPRFFLRLPSLMELLNPYLPMLFIVNVVRSLLAGTCFYLTWRLLRDIPAPRGDPLQAALDSTTAT